MPGPGGEDTLRLKIELERDGFAAGRPILIDKSFRRASFVLENRTGDAHKTGLRFSGPAGFAYELRREGRSVPVVATGDPDYPWRAEIDVEGPAVSLELLRTSGR